MAQLVVSVLKDAMIGATNPNTNFGSHVNLYVKEYLGEGSESFALLSFDISSLPSSIVVSTAPLALYQASGGWLGHTHWVYGLLHGDWVEGEVTFNNRSSGVTWTSGAISVADWTSTNGVSAVIPDPLVQRWVEWDIAALVRAAIGASQTQLNLIVLGLSGTEGTTYYVSSEGVAGLRPELTVNYLVTTVFPTDAITRVTNLIHRYNRKKGIYTLEMSLGEVTSDFGLPEWLSEPMTARPVEEPKVRRIEGRPPGIEPGMPPPPPEPPSPTTVEPWIATKETLAAHGLTAQEVAEIGQKLAQLRKSWIKTGDPRLKKEMEVLSRKLAGLTGWGGQ